MEIYFIADTHFGHKNIIKYENRPFDTVEHMDRTMIDNWNAVVQNQDTVFVLGDFSFYNKTKTQNILEQLKGKKILVVGNHDKSSISYNLDLGFDRVYDYPIVYSDYWILSHMPMYMNSNMPYINIFGHVHGNREYTDFSSNSFCVSVERIDYTPINFIAIQDKIKQLNI